MSAYATRRRARLAGWQATPHETRDWMVAEMQAVVFPRRTWLHRLLRRKPLPPSPIVGRIWRWDHADVLTKREADYWETHTLPWGWSITSWQ